MTNMNEAKILFIFTTSEEINMSTTHTKGKYTVYKRQSTTSPLIFNGGVSFVGQIF